MNSRTFSTYPSISIAALALALTACSEEPAAPGGGAGTGTGGAAAGAAGANVGGAAAGMAAGGAAAGVAGVAGAAIGGAGAATGGAPGGGGATAGSGTGGSGPPMGLPASDSKDDMLAFLTAKTYRNAPWIAESAAPRPQRSSSPHGKVQVWMNPPLVDSLRNGRTGAAGSMRPDQWSMAVKEMYDDADMLVGHAVTYRSGPAEDAPNWLFLCYAPGTRCDGSNMATLAAPIYSRGTSGNSCYFCHSLSPNLQPVITQPPPL